MFQIHSRIIRLSTFFAACLIIGACNSNHQQSATDSAYIKKIDEWHRERIESLKEKDSWLSLAGLFELEEGAQTMGSDSTNDMVFPPKAPKRIGTITKQGDSFTFLAADDVTILKDASSQVSQTTLIPDNKGEPTVLQHGALLWYIIERRGNYYIRLKDTKHSNFAEFDGIDRFPVSPKWNVKANFHRFDTPKAISIPDVLGDVYQDSLYGQLKFTIKGTDYTLAPLGHPDKDEEFFVILGDQTNGNSTYGGGRYIYVSTPDDNGVTHIDFNKAYNPPCVFTDFATCPLPPAQNRLDLEVTAGEKMYHKSP